MEDLLKYLSLAFFILLFGGIEFLVLYWLQEAKEEKRSDETIVLDLWKQEEEPTKEE